MFLYIRELFRNLFETCHSILLEICVNTRKEYLSPHKNLIKSLHQRSIRALFFASLPGSLTVEAAVVVPLFLFFMTGALQYGKVMETAARFGTAMADTGKGMAVAAYTRRYGGETDGLAEFAVGALSAAYAQNKVVKQAGDISCVRNTNMLLSSFLQEDEMIDLVLTYQIRSPIGVVKLPGSFFIQRAKVRAWTGRVPPGGDGDGDTGDGDAQEMVYVTETGTVYHDDPDCTHLKLSIRAVDIGALDLLRNNNGAIYHPCEKCGGRCGSTVYITEEGNRYHSSLTCSGLKRTVRQISKEEAGSLRACSKCGKGN